MKTFEIDLPDGRTVEVDAPDAATAARVAARYQRLAAPESPAERDAKRRVGNTPDQIRAMSQGATFGFADELDGIGAALETGGNNLVRAMTGRPSVGYGMREAYDAVTAANRQADAKFSEEHPWQAIGLGLAGGVVAPGVIAAGRFIGGAPGVVGAMTRSGAVGAGYGAISGAGAGEDLASRALGGLRGGAAGALTGAALPPVLSATTKGLKRMGSGLVEAGSRVAQGVGLQPRDPTARQVERAGEAALDYVSSLARKSAPLADNAMEAAGKPILAAEAMGRPGVSQLAAVGRRAGTTPDALEAKLSQRASSMPERVQDGLYSNTGVSPAAVEGDFVAHAKELRDAAAPLYDQAYAVGGIDSPKLRALLNRPALRRAMARAMSIAQEEGRNPAEIGFELRSVRGPARRTTQTWTETERVPGGGTRDVVRSQEVPASPEMADELVELSNPTAQTWDYVKRGMDDIMEGYRDTTTGRLVLDEKGRAELGTLNILRKELIDLNPAYGRALEAGGEPLRLEEAFKSAKKLLGPAVSERVFLQRYEGYSPAQREALKGGFLNKVYEDLRNGRLRLKDVNVPAFQTKARTILGPEAGEAFLADIGAELQLGKTGARITPGLGSPTMELQAADAERKAVTDGLKGAARTLAEGRPVSAVAQAVSSPLVGMYRGMQTPIDQATRDEVGRLLMMAPSELDALIASRPMTKPQFPVSSAVTATAANAEARQMPPIEIDITRSTNPEHLAWRRRQGLPAR